MKDLAIAVKGLLKSKKYADLTLRCEGESFRLHCAIVCTRSPVLAAMVDGQFKEAIMRDINLEEDELPVVQAMIDYLYTGDYTEPKSSKSPAQPSMVFSLLSESSGTVEYPPPTVDEPAASVELAVEEPADDEWSQWAASKKEKTVSKKKKKENIHSPEALVFHVKMYIMGDKYDIPSLKYLARMKYEAAVVWCWNTTSFSESANLLWDNTVDSDRSLRAVVAQAAKDNIRTLLDREEFVEFMTCYGEFGVDVLRLVIK